MLPNRDPLIIGEKLGLMFPDAHCELNYHNVYELSIAVILSAQTTDKAVNLVTPQLYNHYPNIESLAKANQSDVEPLISRIGLAKTKAKNIISFARCVVSQFEGVIPHTIDELVTLPGVGRKTANVIISEGFGLPGFAVDVHVTRVTNRLGLVNTLDPVKIEHQLKEMYPAELWHTMHHRFIFLGRNTCKAKKPLCEQCLLKPYCAASNK